jgi:hypothetical protein
MGGAVWVPSIMTMSWGGDCVDISPTGCRYLHPACDVMCCVVCVALRCFCGWVSPRLGRYGLILTRLRWTGRDLAFFIILITCDCTSFAVVPEESIDGYLSWMGTVPYPYCTVTKDVPKTMMTGYELEGDSMNGQQRRICRSSALCTLQRDRR